ncbi:MAG: ABC transporter permease, partial [Planctomycetota bacterium]
SWYDADAWKNEPMRFEREKLEETAAEDLTDSMRRRRARLRIEAPFPGVFRGTSSKSIVLTYAGFESPASFPMDRRQFKNLINQFILPTVINLLLGFVLIFLGILVTASLIPDLLQPGSLHLLLSKPISRTLLLLTKFLGGCSFVFLCVTQLIVGLWLISGARLDIWNHRLIWCIPVCVFLFAVFYSVSMLAALRWRSAIVSISVTCMFGALVFVVGFIGGVFDGFIQRPDSITSLATTTQGQVLAVTRDHSLKRFDEPSNRWEVIIDGDVLGRDRLVPPVILNGDTVALAEIANGRFNSFGSGPLDLMTIRADDQWEPERNLRLPVSTATLFSDDQGNAFAKNSGGLFAASADRIRQAIAPSDDEVTGNSDSEDASAKSSNEQPGWLSKLMNMQGAATEDFKSILPKEITLFSPNWVTVAANGKQAWIISLGKISLIRRPPGGDADSVWQLAATNSAEGNNSVSARMAVSLDDAGEGLLVVKRNGEQPQFFDAASLEKQSVTFEGDQMSEQSDSQWISAVGLPTIEGVSRIAIINVDGEAGIVSSGSNDETSGRSVSFQPLPFNDVETLHFERHTGTLWIAHQLDSLDQYDLTTMASIRSIRPSLGGWRFFDRYAMTPLRTVIPQTGELGGTVSAIISGETSVQTNGGPGGQSDVVRYRIWRPVLGCAGFIAVVLLLGCVYFSRSDF